MIRLYYVVFRVHLEAPKSVEASSGALVSHVHTTMSMRIGMHMSMNMSMLMSMRISTHMSMHTRSHC